MNICVFASGAGTNFKAILDSIKKGKLKSKISLLVSNNPDSGAIKIAKKYKINFMLTDTKDKDSKIILTALKKYKVDFIVLAGYLKMIPVAVLKKFEEKIINIHPALLPSFGGKGMYGINVHKAVIKRGVKVSGITIHFVNENYDEGKIIFQKCCDVRSDDDEFALQRRIQKMEHKYYTEVIRKFEEK